jgi:hypothetical protein
MWSGFSQMGIVARDTAASNQTIEVDRNSCASRYFEQ